uniref:Beta-defensin-like domain-containing protein n=1 Tax=Salvator merianae TaxID=96440 RepID=A0A8D0B2T5_SALMN
KRISYALVVIASHPKPPTSERECEQQKGICFQWLCVEPWYQVGTCGDSRSACCKQ